MVKKHFRICKICGRERHTTNTELDYCCEPCLRTRGKIVLLQAQKDSFRLLVGMIASHILAAIIGFFIHWKWF